jgi:peptidoglycan/xylan/chitin deacetylase (PgdA/CDA1 family)
MTWVQLRNLAQDGNEIGGHTRSHVDLTDPGLTPAKRRQEVCDDRRRLVDQGFPAVSFAYPYGAFDPAVEALVASCGYTSARSAGSVTPEGPVHSEKVPPGRPFATFALDTVPGPISLERLQRAVTAAADDDGGWVQVVLHRVCSRTDPAYATCMAGEAPVEDTVLAGFLDWLASGAPPGTVVRTVREVLGSGS